MNYKITAGMYRDGKINITLYTSYNNTTISKGKVVFASEAKKTLKELQLDAIRNGYSEKNGSIQEKELEEMIRLWKKIPENEKEKFFYTCCAGTVGYEDLARLYEQIVG